MAKKVLTIVLALLFLVMGYTTLQAKEGQAKDVPLITQSFASKQTRFGDTWMVYLKASDPNGQMKNIVAEVFQPGVGNNLGITRIKKENQKEFSGYVYLNTFTGGSALNFSTLTLTIWIQDRSGNFSNPVAFPLEFNSRYTQQAPPVGVFEGKDLGPVMVTLGSVGS
jgi:hypothetical protein